MFRRLSALLICAAAGCALAQQSEPFPRPDSGPPMNGAGGVEPRAGSELYPARDTTAGISMGAAVLTRRQIRHVFGSDLKGEFIVVEIGIYPQSQVAISPDQFRLRLGSEPGLLRPTEAAEVARLLGGRKATSTQPPAPTNIQVYQGATIGYGRGPNGRGGVYTSTETGVGIGNYPQPPVAGGPPPPDVPDLERLLVESELPDVKTAAPVAGYLYFRKPPQHGKIPAYNITWYGPIAQLHVSVLPPDTRNHR